MLKKEIYKVYLYLVFAIAAYPLASNFSFQYGIEPRTTILIHILFSAALFGRFFVDILSTPNQKYLIYLLSIITYITVISMLSGGVGLIIVINLFIGFLTLFAIRSNSSVEINIDKVIIVSFLMLFLSYILFINSFEEFSHIRITKYGGFGSTSLMAMYAGMLLIFCVFSGGKLNSIIAIICIFVLLHLASRGAILSTYLAILCLEFGRRRYGRILFLILFPIITIPMVFVFTDGNNFIVNVIYRMFNGESINYTSGRLDASIRYLNLYFSSNSLNEVLFGFPLGSSKEIAILNKSNVASNEYIYYLFELGLVGLLLYLTLTISFLKKALMVLRVQKNALPLSMVVMYFTAALHNTMSGFPTWFLVLYISFKFSHQGVMHAKNREVVPENIKTR
jgi:hypothetical protein